MAIDFSQYEPATLINSVVLAWHKDLGLQIRRLKRVGATDVLVSEADRNTSNGVALDRSWRILGSVIWWLSRPK